MSTLRLLTIGLLAGLSCLPGRASTAAEQIPTAGSPPHAYRLDELSIRLTRLPGRPNFPVRRVSLPGTGNTTLERNGETLHFPYPRQDLLGVLNELYRLRFFDLPADHGAHPSVSLKPDGTIVTTMRRVLDTESTTLCFAVATYEKCVTWTGEGPCGLDALSRRIFAEADRLSRRALPDGGGR